MRKGNRSGFTLVEILVVVAIILLLSGMLFKVGSMLSDRANRAQALAELQQIANALEEYFANYGMYPPTQGMRYVYEAHSMQPPAMVQSADYNADGLSWGLASFLFSRGIDDDRRDPTSEHVKQRWQHYVADLQSSGAIMRSNVYPGVVLVYSNAMKTIKDPWGRDYQYATQVPYLSYRLWTSVPNSSEQLSVSSSGN
jgi:prepilin-type N-terminal cleavage/methylation domain-containing protein